MSACERLNSAVFQICSFIVDYLSNGVQGVQTRLKRKDRFESK